MAVIINDFEIIDDRSAATTLPAPSTADQPPQSQTALRPEDLERIARHFAARRRRVQAD
jgi:hypothetical protein